MGRVAVVAVVLAACGATGGSEASRRATTTTPSASPTTATKVDAEPTSDIPAPTFVGELEQLWADVPAGCAAFSLEGSLVFSRAIDEPVQPASVLKLFTGVAAVDLLGSTTRLSTRVRGTMGPEGVVDGDLLLDGGGDPVLGTDAWAHSELPDGRLHTSLDTLADRVVAAGVRSVRGAVVGVESRYDVQRAVPSWPQRLVDDGEIGALSALVANDGFEVWGHPGEPFEEPAEGTAQLLRNLLVARGVAFDATPGSAANEPNEPGSVIASIESPTVEDLVAEMLRESDNGTAELLVKEIGYQVSGEGSTAAGVAAIRSWAQDRGLPLDGVVIADGSGLSEVNRVTCRALNSLLETSHPTLDASLAVAAQSGTLRNRLVSTAAAGRIRAKTGSLNGVSGVAGYANTGAGHVAFAVVGNRLPVPTLSAGFQDPFLLAIFNGER